MTIVGIIGWIWFGWILRMAREAFRDLRDFRREMKELDESFARVQRLLTKGTPDSEQDWINQLGYPGMAAAQMRKRLRRLK